MLRRSLFAPLALAMSIGGCASLPFVQSDATPAERQGFDPAALAKIDAHYQAQVEAGAIPGAVVLVARDGEIVYETAVGYADVEKTRPLTTDSLFRIFSMTKPITAVAALQLVEDEALDLDAPLTDFAPAFADMRVYSGGEGEDVQTRPANGPITVRHLITHTAGFSAAWIPSPIAGQYAAAGAFEGIPIPGVDPAQVPSDLDTFATRLATTPLAHDPGAYFTYGVSSDVLGLVVEKVAEQDLARYVETRLIEPLGMRSTAFCVDPADKDRLVDLYTYDEAGALSLVDPAAETFYACPKTFTGGGWGLVSTTKDYFKFAEALRLNGKFDGARILDKASVAQLRNPPAFVDESLGDTWPGGTEWGFSMAAVTDASATDWLDVDGNFYWAGAASTHFWIDPANGIVAMVFLQVMPGGQDVTFKQDIRNLVYGALVDADVTPR